MFNLTTKILKYLLLVIVTFVLTCWWAGISGALPEIMPLLFFSGERLFQLTMLILCVMATEIVVESIKY